MPSRNIEKQDLKCQRCGHLFKGYYLGTFTRQFCDPCCQIIIKEENKKIAEEQRLADEQAQRERVRRARIPQDFQDIRFENSNARIHPAAFHACKNWAQSFKASSPSLIIYSEVFGSGKTHLAACVANYLLHERHVDVRFTKASYILMELRATFDRGSREDEMDVLRRILSPTLLVIDDLGVDSPTDWTASAFWSIFDKRQEMKLPVVITTHYSPDDEGTLANRIGGGALSRLRGMCLNEWIAFKGKDLRRNKTHKEE